MNTLFQLSLLASFVAGIVALFAPCCITFLLPSYFANVFKEKKRVLLMTLIYSFGIATIMLPVVLGARFLTQIFYQLHDQAYIIGGMFMIVVGFIALLGLKLPMPQFSTNRKADDPLSTYILGIFSGITSSCCAPVLIGVITLSSLSPNTFQALLVGVFYVLGMVTPLYLASLLIDKRNILEKPILRKSLREVNLGSKAYNITVSNVVSFVMFTLIGLLTIFLSLTGQLAMDANEMQVAQTIQGVALKITDMVQNIPGLDIVFVIVAAFVFFKFILYALRQK